MVLDLYLIGLAHLGVLGQHLLKGLRHGIAPEEVVVEGSVRVDPGQLVEGEKNTKDKNFCVLPGRGVEGKQPVQKVDSPLVLHVRLQPLLDTPVYYVMISELCINVYDPPIYYIMIS